MRNRFAMLGMALFVGLGFFADARAAAPTANASLQIEINARIPKVVRIEWDAASFSFPGVGSETANAVWNIGSQDFASVVASGAFVVVNKGTARASVKVEVSDEDDQNEWTLKATALGAAGTVADQDKFTLEVDSNGDDDFSDAGEGFFAGSGGTNAKSLVAVGSEIRRNETKAFKLRYTTPPECSAASIDDTHKTVCLLTATAP